MNEPPTPKPYIATPLSLSDLAAGKFVEFTAPDNLQSHQAHTFIELEDRVIWGDLLGQWDKGSGVWSWVEAGYFTKNKYESFEDVFSVMKYLLNQYHKGIKSPFLIHNESYQQDTNKVQHYKLVDVVWDLGKPQ